MEDTRTSASRVLSATDPHELFGDNQRRAQIRYRRLARELHPDMGGSEEAMARLNALWAEYLGRPKRSVSGLRRPMEVMRSRTYAIFRDGGEWLVVERAAGGVARTHDTSGLSALLDGTPVTTLRVTGTTHIAQPDGAHEAWRVEPYDGRLLPVDGLSEHLPDGVLHPADAAWIVKRLLFLGAALAKAGLALESAVGTLAIDPDQHMLVVVAPWKLVASGGNAMSQREPLRALAGSDAMISGGAKMHSINQFVIGSVFDGVTESTSLLREFDELLYELFGPPRFHVMETI